MIIELTSDWLGMYTAIVAAILTLGVVDAVVNKITGNS